MRVLAAMSGGVDSAVAAARCVDAGHDVVGVHLALSRNPASYRSGARGCCTLEDARDARRAADVLGIPFYVWDLAERFHTDVVEDFVAQYAAGRTPNPCLSCNERIKFAAVADRARALGFDAVCTGHYARLVPGPAGPELHRAVDAAKDQSYVLGVLTAEQVRTALFPLGDTPKSAVRGEAAARGLAVAGKPDSHDICFVADGDTPGFLHRRLGPAPGEVVDESGAVVGAHDGAYAFTVGQRRGLRLDRPGADGRARYVLDVSVVNRRVTVGPPEALDVLCVLAERPRWSGPPPADGWDGLVQYRAHGPAVQAAAQIAPGTVTLTFAAPQRGLAPGQAVVLYDGTRVVGSATVESTRPAAAPAAATRPAPAQAGLRPAPAP